MWVSSLNCQYISARSHHVKMLRILVNLQSNLYTILYMNTYNVQNDWDHNLFIYHDSNAVTEYLCIHIIFGLMTDSKRSSKLWPIQFHCILMNFWWLKHPAIEFVSYTMGCFKQTEAINWVLCNLWGSFYAYIDTNPPFQLSKHSEIYFQDHMLKLLM
jgi:hypothetical protein